jgi:hypothetical protein
MWWIVTPLAVTRACHVEDTIRSIETLRKQMPVKWVVALDGEDWELQSCLVNHSAIVLKSETPHCQGVSLTRKRAIDWVGSRANFEDWLVLLDGDDEILPLEATRLARWMEDHLPDDTAWIGTNRDYKGTPNIRHDIDPSMSPRILPSTFEWRKPSIFHPNSLLVQVKLALQVPYPAQLKYNEDLEWFLMLASAKAGWLHPHPLICYRIWTGQLTAEGEYLNPERRDERIQELKSRVNLFRSKLGLPPFR